MSKITKTELDQIVTEAVKKEYSDPTAFKVVEIGFDMPEGTTLYADFKVDGTDDFSYAFVEPDGKCRLFDDGEGMVRFLQLLLDKKRSLWQRFNELNFNDLIGAFIAFVIIGSFAVLVIHTGWQGSLGGNTISKEFLAIVSVVLGFYFGRSRKSES
jgi:hypothetical protein